jgi:DNA-binding NarL/FixJ family response regulator
MIRVLIVDDHAVVRQGLRNILERARGIEIGGEAANGVEALKLLRDGKWDVVILDISMPGASGADILKQILDGDSGARVLVLSSHTEEQYAVRMMKAGASGYLTKLAAPEQLVEAIRRTVAGKKYISPNLAELLLNDCGADSSKPPHELLSNRELQVLRLLGAGKKVSEAAAALSLDARTISTYRALILKKMKLRNNADMIFYVMEKGLVKQ